MFDSAKKPKKRKGRKTNEEKRVMYEGAPKRKSTRNQKMLKTNVKESPNPKKKTQNVTFKPKFTSKTYLDKMEFSGNYKGDETFIKWCHCSQKN